MICFKAKAGGVIHGAVDLPGDKSISHRAIMFSALADGVSHVHGLLEGEDVLATIDAFKAMGCSIEAIAGGGYRISGVGLEGLKPAQNAIDVGNSGTGMRLLMGLLSGQKFATKLIGDASLSKRPMRRVADPLNSMGAHIRTAADGTPPVHIDPARQLKGIRYAMPVASAQLKSAVLLAGLYAQGETVVIEPAPSRDHTERMLRSYGITVQQSDNVVSLAGGQRLHACDITVPRDISSAAFLMVAASIAPNSEIYLPAVGINPTRTGVIDILRAMGGDITLENTRTIGDEPVSDILVRHAPLSGINIPTELVPLAIDEFPALFIAAACASGRTILRGAEELRVKESDRIAVMVEAINALGGQAQATPDGVIIEGVTSFTGGISLPSCHDHRIAMSCVIAALRCTKDITITDCATVNTSFPHFAQLVSQVGLIVDTIEQYEK